MEKTEEQIKKEAMDNIKDVAKKSGADAAEKKVQELTEKFETYSTKEETEKFKSELEEKLKTISVQVKKQGQMSLEKSEDMTIKESIKTVISENNEVIKGYKGNGKVELTSKALTDANFGIAGEYKDITAERQGLQVSPYAPVWLRNIFPNASTSSSSIKYLRRKASTNQVGVWDKSSGDKKTEVTPNFEMKTADVDWIAGTTKVHRDLLQDASFLNSFIPDNLLYSADGIFAAENKYIMDYIEDASNHTDFTGAAEYENNLEKVIAAGFGDLLGAYMQPTHILINNQDYLKYLVFNKAAGSGEYDNVNMLNGQLYINSLQAIPTPAVTVGEAYVIAANESQFVSRMSPEVRMFEQDEDNVSLNLITFRAEERIAFYTKDAKSIIKVAIVAPTPAG